MNARILTAATVAAALAVPAAAQAASSVVAGPLKVRDYEMTIVGADGAKDSLSVMFSKTKGTSSQMHMYQFDRGVKVTPTSISGSLGPYGAVSLELRDASTAKGSVPKGCTGNPGSTKRGTMSGSFKLVADKTYFKTVKATKMPGMASTGGNLRCDGAGGGSGTGQGGGRADALMVNEQGPDGMLTFTATKGSQSAMRMDDESKTGPARIMHMISAEGAGLSVKGGASATAKGIAPFLRGTGTFEGERSGTMATGTLGGSLTAAFDSIGAVKIDGEAMLMGG